MKSFRKFISLPLIFLSFTVLLTACDNGLRPGNNGELQLDITDAPIDTAEVSAVFVTVADVQVDGEGYAGFEGKQTVNLLAL